MFSRLERLFDHIWLVGDWKRDVNGLDVPSREQIVHAPSAARIIRINIYTAPWDERLSGLPRPRIDGFDVK
jgi:hypothetical protein